LFARQFFSDSIFAEIEIPLQQIKSLKVGQAGAFFSSESAEKKRTKRGGLSVS
jgi:hypothetical protein